jgi:hypothetical protein
MKELMNMLGEPIVENAQTLTSGSVTCIFVFRLHAKADYSM